MLLILFIYILYLWVFCLHVCLCNWPVQCLQNPEEGIRYPELECQWVLGMEPRSSGRAASALNPCTSLQPYPGFRLDIGRGSPPQYSSSRPKGQFIVKEKGLA